MEDMRIVPNGTEKVDVTLPNGETKELSIKNIFDIAYSDLPNEEDTFTLDSRFTKNAKLLLEADSTLIFKNLESGCEGNVIVTQDGTGAWTLDITPTPFVVNNGGGVVAIAETAGAITILSYTFDGTNLFVTFGVEYTNQGS
jgi:hypothetical protein